MGDLLENYIADIVGGLSHSLDVGSSARSKVGQSVGYAEWSQGQIVYLTLVVG